ncbi:hypothetical protein SELMODRAFT_446040 [Selaginella moellendorffii]|uniref:Fe2OG dioxygenase domain-containing protein n=1 Tax=Selaginella moellendorffii TaxID=88036 RepID=D8SN80_SELML|nr:uncharacterized protein LOC9645109 [Selaginella moellendorffii]EFJ14123.1 hypothetical protein SELMODRAFT_446040 [Selaginella moellendorffii]|eukprot:XP_002984873.1 uncharacterized protein LOC9645109 [Selaginella moellendorffii]
MAAMPNQLPHRLFVDEAKAAGIPPPGQPPPPLVQPWIPDERDSFISWLRSEFAAANAIIDAMCQHLPVVASCPGEYDFVLNCVRQRRYNWTAVLHMQQYFSVEEVVMALQQVALKRRHLHQQQGIGSGSDGGGALWGDSDFRRPNFSRAASTPADKKENFVPETSKSDSDISSKAATSEEKISGTTAIAAVGGESIDEVGSHQQEGQSGQHDQSLASVDRSSERTAQARSSNGKPQELVVKVSKNFQSLENVDGRVINAVEGLRICENVFSSSEIERLVSSLSDLQGVGRKVELGATGYRILGGKRFLKGKSSDLMIQQNADNTEDAQKSSSQDDTPDSLPEIVQFIADRLLEQHIIPASKRPDSYIINFLGEGGYLPPQTNSQEFDQPFCIITLQSDCSMVFGRFISMESPREFRGQFRISASIGSVIVLQGNSAKLARYAVPALPTKRCCLILGKTLVKRFSRNMGFQRSSSSGGLLNTSMRPAANSSSGGGGGGNNPMASSPMQQGFPATGVPASPTPASPPQGGPFPPLPLPVMVPGCSPVPRPGRFNGTGVFLPYAAPNGPGRPMGSGHRSKGPVLQRINSLPASFRSSQNGPASSAVNSGKSLADDPGASSITIGSGSNSQALDQSASSDSSDRANNFTDKL